MNLHLCRYEGQRSAEALAEFVNSEAGRPLLLPKTVFNHAFMFLITKLVDSETYIYFDPSRDFPKCHAPPPHTHTKQILCMSLSP
jgi:hypothetical protein